MKIKVICRKDRITQNGKAPLYIRFSNNRKIKYVALGITILPEYWHEELQVIADNCPDKKELQFKIDTQLKEYERKLKKLEALEVNADFEDLIGKGSNRSANLIQYVNVQITNLIENEKYGTASKYQVTCSLLKDFRPNAIFNEINYRFLQDFELYLHKPGNQSNSIATKMSVLKAIYNKALKEKLFIPKDNPFNDFKVGKLWKPTRKRAILKQDIKKLVLLELPSDIAVFSLSFARDIFMFSYYGAGINFKDIATLRFGNINNKRIYYKRHKTGKELNIPILPELESIINKYASLSLHSKASDEDYIFPILSRTTHVTEQQIFNRVHKVLGHVNRNLKTLGELIGLRIPLSTYVARHSFATVMKRSGVNIAIISETLGHSDLKTTQIYLDSFDNKQIDEAMKHLL